MKALMTTPRRVHTRSIVEGEAPPRAPIVAAVDASAASEAATDAAIELAAELEAPLVFVHVRRGPAAYLGEPIYQRRLTREMNRARQVLDRALATAARAGISAEAEILEGSPRKRIAEFAGDRGARLVAIGRRERKLGPSVSSGVVRTAGTPVVVAKGLQRLAVAA